uniref:WecB/TagA/CpsF family glycosyltransferase n=1 Tax=uncultured Bacteroides sp. TaxID=162156 RepID=UPI00280AECDF|nr:WecB/TagA/CpsF family glycosyltransferase [uncultured Bacteroides sp.]
MSFETKSLLDTYSIGNVHISQVNLISFSEQIEYCVKNKILGYVCVTNSRTVYLSQKDNLYANIQNSSLLTVPDGMPLIWIAHNMGYKSVGRTCGPDIFNLLLEKSVSNGYSHYFYGGSSNSISIIQAKCRRDYAGIVIKGAISPPFQSIDKFNINSIANEINKLKPTFFWCGLGAPKQEILMSRLQPLLTDTICIGVGLVFDYYAGTVQRSPKWMQKVGLEWLYRVLQQPLKSKRVFFPFLWISFILFKSMFCKLRKKLDVK